MTPKQSTREDWLPLSAMEIQDRVRISAPDLVLSDYQMPGVFTARLASAWLRWV